MSAAIKRGDVNRALRSAGAQFAVIEKSCGKRRCVTAGLDTTQVADSVRVDFQVSTFDQTLLSVQSLVAAKEILEDAGFAVEVHTMMFALADRIIDAPDQNRPSAADAAEWRVDHSAIVETGFGRSWGVEIAHWLTVRATDQPIRLTLLGGTHRHAGNFYANVNGIARGSIGVYFDRDGNILAHTIDGGRMAGVMIEKLLAEIERRGIKFPEEVQS